MNSIRTKPFILSICASGLLILLGSCSPSEEQDSEYSRAGFRKVLGFAPGKDVGAVCYYASPRVLKRHCLSFTASDETVGRILQSRDFQKKKPGADADSYLLRDWWKSGCRMESDYYVWRSYEGECLRTELEFWHHPQTGRCQAALHSFSTPGQEIRDSLRAVISAGKAMFR